MSHLKLRPYQEQALAAEDAYRDEHPDENRLVIEMATGLGKTITFAERARRFLVGRTEPWQIGWDHQRVLILVHTDELAAQAMAKVRLVVGQDWTVGLVKAESNDVSADIIVASVQTLAQPGRREQIQDVGYIVVDECQHATASTYKDILEHFGGLGSAETADYVCVHGSHECCADWPGTVPVLGVTATLARSDGTGFGQVFHNVVFSRSTSWGIRHGYLIDLVPYTIRIPELDASASDSRLDTMLVNSMAPETVVEAWRGQAIPVGRLWPAHILPSTVLFAPLVASAREFARSFEDAGIKAEVIHGAMPKSERLAVLERYEAGVTTVLCNAMVLTEGWDSPRTMCVIVARPTKSAPLFVQMVGRGLRPWLAVDAPPREDQRCILLCVQDTTTQLATVADLSDRAGEVVDGRSLVEMEDQWDLGKDIEPDPEHAYRGPVVVERWDAAVQASSKAWKYTNTGAPFLPTAKRGEGYVFIVGSDVFAFSNGVKAGAGKVATAPDLELAMALAEDEALERGGDIGRMLADKNRAWRRAVPSAEMISLAQRLGINVTGVVQSKQGSKAGRLSDLIDRAVASRTLDPIVRKIKERTGQSA